MVCIRCKMVVMDELEKHNLSNISVSLGYAKFKENLTQSQILSINTNLIKSGLEVIEDKKYKVIENIKAAINEYVLYPEETHKVKLSDHIRAKLDCNYAAVSKIFSEIEGISIEKFHTIIKIDKVKELLIYKNLTLTEISYQLNYSSLSHLSAQFKNVTGLNASHFKGISLKRNG